MADGSIVFETALDNKTLEKELSKLQRKIKTLNDQMYIKQQQKIPMVEQAKKLGAELDLAKAKLFEMQSGEKFYTSASIQEQTQSVNQLQKEWDKVNDQIDRMDKGIRDTQIKADVFKTQAGEIEKSLAEAGADAEKMSAATKRAATGARKFGNNLKFALKSIVLYSTLFQVFALVTEWMKNLITVNDEASQSVARLKGSFLTLIQPLVQVVIPVFSTLVNILAAALSKIATLVSAIFGTTAEASADAAKGLYDEMEALDGTSEAAKEASKSLASFDEINQLSGDTAAASAGAAAGAGEITPDFDTSFISEGLDQIVTLLGGALLAVGAVLAFSGANIPLGIGLMAAGALILGSEIYANWGAISEALQGPIGVITALLSGSLLVIGAIMAFSGANIPVGIGLMLMGAAGLATTVAVNWDSITNALQGPIGSVFGVLSASLLVIGAILAFSGVATPLGITLMAVGAAGLVTSIAANWNSMTPDMQLAVTAIMSVLSVASLVIGGVLAFSGVNVPLGIALIAIGAAGLASTAALNWDYLMDALEGPVGAITALISAALLVLGAILLFTGVAAPLGLGLIAVGAVGLVASIAANWDYLTSLLGGTVGAITAIVSAALLVLGVILLFTGAAAPLGLGMLIAGGVGLAVAVAPNWDFILDAIKGAWSSVKNWWTNNAQKYFTTDYWFDVGGRILNGLLDGLKSVWSSITSWVSEGVSWITNAFSGAKASVSAEYQTSGTSTKSLDAAARMVSQAPRLAAGAVIPPNREFMAVLGDQKQGTNIETPLSTMVQAFRQAMSEMGYNGQGEAVLEVDGQQFGKLVYKYNSKESRRVGTKLVEA